MLWLRFWMCAILTVLLDASRANDRQVHATLAHKPNPEQLAFFSNVACAQKCILQCQPIMAENQNTLYLCPKLKPPEKSLSERFIAEASWPWLFFLGVLALSVFFCLLCMCWSCCSRSRRRADHSSREPLAIDRRIEEIIGDHPDHPHHQHIIRGERIHGGSKYVVDV
ncbi:hypothetical protein M3Y98_01110200 [Aphelenchoides besseyi]|nr:hypothetical protein M3Y98_01110200 [Aphelenchoides besseyi]KAI6209228.1 hypothetical protein M3Y96_00199100 [Aphelenchoides besseyi]